MTTGGRRAGSSREDELLSRLYQQVTEQQAARFGAGYDIDGRPGPVPGLAGRARRRRPGRAEVIQAEQVMALAGQPRVAGAAAAAASPSGPSRVQRGRFT